MSELNIAVLEALIAQAADAKSGAAYEALFAGLRGAQLFVQLDSEVQSDTVPASIPLFDAGNGLRVVLLTLTPHQAEGARKRYASLLWEDALAMLLEIPEAHAVLVRNTQAAWVAVDKVKAQDLLRAARQPQVELAGRAL